VIADPLHLLECCMVSDGGGAVVIVSKDVARDIKKKPVWIIGSGEATKYVENGGDITTSAGAQSGPEAFGEAGVTPSEIDIAMIYDSFTITVAVMLEDLGFCKKGEFGDLGEGRPSQVRPEGRPALNTDGGGLSSNHPGMRGIFLLLEAARQLRGESTSQVPVRSSPWPTATAASSVPPTPAAPSSSRRTNRTCRIDHNLDSPKSTPSPTGKASKRASSSTRSTRTPATSSSIPACTTQDRRPNLEWRESKGLGTVYTYSVVRQSAVPGFRELGAYSVAYVDLDEGFRMLTSIVGVDDPTKDIKIGMRVKVEFEKQDEGDYPIPVFRPAE
jgi:uncharacterized OB-fold protein